MRAARDSRAAAPRQRVRRLRAASSRRARRGCCRGTPWRSPPRKSRARIRARRSRGELERAERRLAQIGIEDAGARVGDHVLRPGHREGGDREARGERLEQHVAEGVGDAREDEDVGRGIGLDQLLGRQRAEEMRLRDRLRTSSARAGPSPTTTFEPGRSSFRKASRFFSTATRPTERKIGRGRPRSASGRGRKSAWSTPRDQKTRFLKPRRARSSRSDRSPPCRPQPALWKRRMKA